MLLTSQTGMKKEVLISIVLVTQLFAPSLVEAQGTVRVSNVDQTPTGSMGVDSDSWIAQSFRTGTNGGGYMLDSIQLLMNAATGSPSGFSVLIYSNLGNGVPGSSLGSLSGSDPVGGGLLTYAASDLLLSPSTSYFVVVTAEAPVMQGVYNWSSVANGFASSDGWSIPVSYSNSTDGSSWTWHLRQDVFQLSIDATLIPEPSAMSLIFLAGLMVGWHSFRKSARRNKEGVLEDALEV